MQSKQVHLFINIINNLNIMLIFWFLVWSMLKTFALKSLWKNTFKVKGQSKKRLFKRAQMFKKKFI